MRHCFQPLPRTNGPPQVWGRGGPARWNSGGAGSFGRVVDACWDHQPLDALAGGAVLPRGRGSRPRSNASQPGPIDSQLHSPRRRRVSVLWGRRPRTLTAFASRHRGSLGCRAFQSISHRTICLGGDDPPPFDQVHGPDNQTTLVDGTRIGPPLPSSSSLSHRFQPDCDDLHDRRGSIHSRYESNLVFRTNRGISGEISRTSQRMRAGGRPGGYPVDVSRGLSRSVSGLTATSRFSLLGWLSGLREAPG